MYHIGESQNEDFCGDFKKISFYFEYYTHNLEKEINQRKKIEVFFLVFFFFFYIFFLKRKT